MSKISKWEENKLKVPLTIGLFVGVIVFLVLTFSTLFGGETSFELVMMNNLLLSVLIVGLPTAIIQIVLVYIVKVVKMKPKSSYDIGNIDDYIELVERFKSGDYEYETIRSKEHLFVAHKMGKKIVFTEHRFRVFIWIGLGFIIFGLILSVIMFFVMDTELEIFRLTAFIIPLAICTTIGAFALIPGIIKYVRSPRTFFILAPEGIVYRTKWTDVRAYSWKELDLNVYTKTTTMRSMGGLVKTELPPSIEVHITLPNGSRFKFIPWEYNLSEFIDLKKFRRDLKEGSEEEMMNRFRRMELYAGNERRIIPLVVMAFKLYFDAAKAHFETQSTQEAGWKTNLIRTQEKDAKKEEIYNYIKINSGKAFTVQSLFNRINEIGLSEKVKNKLDLKILEQILEDLVLNGEITREDKDGKVFYYL